MSVDLGLLYIREHYKVPAKEGVRIRFDYPQGTVRQGTILRSEADQYLLVKFDHGPREVLHPTWKVTYLDGGA